jgi:hypothetical protein
VRAVGEGHGLSRAGLPHAHEVGLAERRARVEVQAEVVLSVHGICLNKLKTASKQRWKSVKTASKQRQKSVKTALKQH